MKRERKGWMDELPNVLWAHRTSLKTSNSEALYSLTFGSEAVIPAEIGMRTHRTMMIKEGNGNEEEMRLNLDLLTERREATAIQEASWYQERKFLIKMSPRRSEGEELEYPFFEGDGSSFDEWRDYGVAGDDYEGPLIFDDDQFEDEFEMRDDAFFLIGKEVALNSEIPEAMFPLLEEFSDVFHDELPYALPPLYDIQHHIDLEPSLQFPNMPHYRLCPGEHEELHRQVEEFVSKGQIHKIMSMCAQPRGPLDLMSLHVSGSVPKKVQDFVEGLPYHSDSSINDLVGNSRTNFFYPWGNDAGLSVEEQALLFLEA
nr:putative reverse transcriptase domain-containing protein [Tanacetum cinerariifolium]